MHQLLADRVANEAFMRTQPDATALCRGDSRSWLRKTQKELADATALCRGGSRFLIKFKGQLLRVLSVKLHGASPWHLQRDLRLFL